MKKKLFAIIMSAMMIVSLLPAMSFAAIPAKFRVVSAGTENAVETATINNLKMVKEGGYKYVDTDTLESWIKNGEDMILIDTMPYFFIKNNGCIPTAISAEATCGKYSPESMRAEFTTWMKSGLKDATGYSKITKKTSKKAKNAILNKKIVVYCGFVGCDRSHTGAKYLKSLGFKNVYRYIGGGAAWEDAGKEFGTLSGEKVITAAALKENAKKYTIIDARKAEDFAKGHIDGAVSADMVSAVDAKANTAEGKANMAAAVGDKNLTTRKFVLVCYSGNKYATAAKSQLMYLGVPAKNIYILGQDDGTIGANGGMKAWEAAGYEVVK